MSGFILSSYAAFFIVLISLGAFLVLERRHVKNRLERLGPKPPNTTPSK